MAPVLLICLLGAIGYASSQTTACNPQVVPGMTINPSESKSTKGLTFSLLKADAVETETECAAKCCLNETCDVAAFHTEADDTEPNCFEFQCRPIEKCQWTSEKAKVFPTKIMRRAATSPIPSPTPSTTPMSQDSENEKQHGEVRPTDPPAPPTIKKPTKTPSTGKVEPTPTPTEKVPTPTTSSAKSTQEIVEPPTAKAPTTKTPTTKTPTTKTTTMQEPPAEGSKSNATSSTKKTTTLPTTSLKTTLPPTPKKTTTTTAPPTTAAANKELTSQQTTPATSLSTEQTSVSATSKSTERTTMGIPAETTSTSSPSVTTEAKVEISTETVPMNEITLVSLTTTEAPVTTQETENTSTQKPEQTTVPVTSGEVVNSTEFLPTNWTVLEVSIVNASEAIGDVISKNFTINRDKEKSERLSNTAVLITVLTFGIVFVLIVAVVIGKRLYESYQRREYSKIDYLINGMYN